MLCALEDAAHRGDELTSRLLSKKAGQERRLIDVGAQIADAAPMLQAVVRAPASLEIDAQVALPAALVKAAPAELEAVMLELVANARAAGAGRIMIRCRRIGCRIWIAIADDGSGLLSSRMTTAPRSGETAGHGIGLSRVRRAVRDMNGRLSIRGRAGAGTVVAIILPVALSAVSKSRASEWGASPQHKESCDEDRRTVAA
ncbi:ATP-binding protein [Sphingobium sp.]|uniref:ATP-binding protein n=1 Tax=Sphingobium sp. TaxID=1912891 RepID=UPI0035C6E343